MVHDHPSTPSVLVVEDNASLAENYEHQLSKRFNVTVATDGDEALATVSDDVDVLFLDRRLPGRSGDEVLERVRERDLDVRVVMVTGVTPDFDILDMGFDDYLVKPVGRRELVETTERMLARADFDAAAREYYAVCARKAALEDAKPAHELAASDEYTRIEERVHDLRDDVDAAVTNFESGDFRAAFHAIPTPGDD